jgi:hypothetical protein
LVLVKNFSTARKLRFGEAVQEGVPSPLAPKRPARGCDGGLSSGQRLRHAVRERQLRLGGLPRGIQELLRTGSGLAGDASSAAAGAQTEFTKTEIADNGLGFELWLAK